MMPKFEKGKFRICNRELCLTYADCPVPKDVMTAHIKKTLQVRKLMIARELHKNGQPHLHLWILLNKVLETQNCRFADITFENTVYHPEVKAVNKKEGGRNGWQAYLCKEDPECALSIEFDDSSPHNFTRRKKDYDTYIAHWSQKNCSKLNKQIELHVQLPETWRDEYGTRGPIHEFTGRMGGGMVLIGPSFVRKTTMVIGTMNEKTGEWYPGWLSDRNVFKPVGDNPMYHFEGYADQEWIVYDDVIPSPGHLILLLQTYREPLRPVPGQPRYSAVMMTGPLIRNVIVILNEDRQSKIDWKQQGLDTRLKVYRYGPIIVNPL